MKRNIIEISGIIVVTTLLFSVVALTNVYAEKDKKEEKKSVNYDGEEVTEDAYKERVGYCGNMKLDGEIPMTIDCKEWFLTEEGNYELVKYFLKISVD